MIDLRHQRDISAVLARLKHEAGSHSPSIATIRRELPEVTVAIDACFLSNPYATQLFLDYVAHDLVETGRLRRVVELYPSQNAELARRIAGRLAVAPDCVFVGNGATEIIQALLHAGGVRTVLLNLPTFSPYYEFVRPGTKVVYHQLQRENAFRLNIDAYLAQVQREQPDTVVLINPNNPDGGFLPLAELRSLLRALSRVATVILDESFVHFAAEDAQMTAISFAGLRQEFRNLVIVKSMSKDFGIAGIRAGYAIMDAARVRHLLNNGYLWNSSGLAEYFFELWSRDEFAAQYELARTRYVREARALFRDLSQIAGMVVYPSQANFVLVELVNGASTFDFVCRLLVQHGIYTRSCGDKRGLTGEFVRIAARSAAENQRIVQGVQAIMRQLPATVAVAANGDGGCA